MADKEKTFDFVVVGGGIAGVTCVEQVKMNSLAAGLDLRINVLT